MTDMVTIALSKGRILEDTLPFLAGMGVELVENPEKSRKLIIGTSDPRLRIIIVRASDVPTYVQRGAADLGVAGKDVLLEQSGDSLFELVDLGIARCCWSHRAKPLSLFPYQCRPRCRQGNRPRWRRKRRCHQH